MSAKSVLVTGGAGYLGSVLVRELCHLTQYDITVADNFTWGFNSILALLHHERLQFLNVDLTEDFDYSLYDLIVNLAAIPGEVLARQQPERSYQVNYILPLRIANSLKPHQSMIQISSTAVYGDVDGATVDENTTLEPRPGIYAKAKERADQILEHYPKVAIVRLGTLYGPSLVMRPYMLIHDLVKEAVRHKTIHVYGRIEATRPLIYVSSAAIEIIRIMKSIEDHKGKTKILARQNMTKRNIVDVVSEVCEAEIFRTDKQDLVIQNHVVQTLPLAATATFHRHVRTLKRLFEAIG